MNAELVHTKYHPDRHTRVFFYFMERDLVGPSLPMTRKMSASLRVRRWTAHAPVFPLRCLLFALLLFVWSITVTVQSKALDTFTFD